jgi:hypothetical protein
MIGVFALSIALGVAGAGAIRRWVFSIHGTAFCGHRNRSRPRQRDRCGWLRRSILIANAYFVPDPAALDALLDANRRGVNVRVMVAGRHNDNWLWCNRQHSP